MTAGNFSKVYTDEQERYLMEDEIHEEAAAIYFTKEEIKHQKQQELEKSEREHLHGIWFDPHNIISSNLDGQAIKSKDFSSALRAKRREGDKEVSLIDEQDSQKKRVRGHQLSYNAPKQLSVIWAIADDELKQKLEQAHQNALIETAQVVDRDLLITSSGHGRNNEVKANGCAAIISHRTARAADDLVAPHLHGHVIFFGMGQRESDKKVKAINEAKYLNWRSYADNAGYGASLARELQKIGLEVEVTPGKNTWSIKGMEQYQEVMERLSVRERNIRIEMGKKGYDDDRTTWGRRDNEAAYVGRESKVQQEREVLDLTWQNEIRKAGFTPEQMREHVNGLIRENKANPRQPHVWTTEEIDKLRDQITKEYHEKRSAFTEGQLHGRVAFYMQGKSESIEEIKLVAAQVQAGLVEVYRDKNNKYFASKEQVELERRMVELAKTVTPHHVLDKKIVEEEIAKVQTAELRAAGRAMNESQANAIRGLTYGPGSCRMVSISEGGPGSGKSWSSDVARNVYERHNFRVIGCAVGWCQADVLKKDCHLDQVWSMEGLCRSLEKGKLKLDAKTVIMVDEFSLVSVKDAVRLMSAVEKASGGQAKVVFLGDTKQILSVGPSAARLLSNELGSTRIGINASEIIRQNVGWQKQATVDLLENRVGDAIKAYREHGHFHIAKNKQESLDGIVNSLKKHLTENPDKGYLVIANTNRDVDTLNEKIFAAKRELGLIKGKEYEVIVGDEKSQYPVTLAQGMKIQFRSNTQRDEEIYNRTTGVISKIDDDGKNPPVFHVKLKNGKETSFSARPDDPVWTKKEGGQPYFSIQPAECQTVFSSQGGTESKTLVAASDLSKRLYLVGATRHRDDVEFHVDRASLATTIQKPGEPYRSPNKFTDAEIFKALEKRFAKDDEKLTTYEMMRRPEEREADFAALQAESAAIAERAQDKYVRAHREAEQQKPAVQGDLTLNPSMELNYEQYCNLKTVSRGISQSADLAPAGASTTDLQHLHDVPRLQLVHDYNGQQQDGTPVLLQDHARPDLLPENGSDFGVRRTGTSPDRDASESSSGSSSRDVTGQEPSVPLLAPETTEQSASESKTLPIWQPGADRPDLREKLDSAPVIVACGKSNAQNIAQQEVNADCAATVIQIESADDPALRDPTVQRILRAENRDIHFAGDVDGKTKEAVMAVADGKTENHYRDLVRDRGSRSEEHDIDK